LKTNKIILTVKM